MRKNIRLIGYDYSSNGSYFITICTKERKNCLSEISVGEAALHYKIGPADNQRTENDIYKTDRLFCLAKILL